MTISPASESAQVRRAAPQVASLIANSFAPGSPVFGKPELRVFTAQRHQQWQAQHDEPSPELWRFEKGFASLRRMLVGASQEARWQVFQNIACETATYVLKGWPKQLAVDALSDTAEANGLVAAYGQDAVQAVLAKAFDAEQEQAPDDNSYTERPKANGHDKDGIPAPFKLIFRSRQLRSRRNGIIS